MNLVLPRVIKGNRGDIASRWSLLRSLQILGLQNVAVFSQFADDVPNTFYKRFDYGKVRNLLPEKTGWRILRQSDVVLWSVGLDFQDDSSLAKLIYLWLLFHVYRLLGLKIWCAFQGAGPINTSLGKKIATSVLSCIDVFIARDQGTYELISSLSTRPHLFLGYDAIFLPGLEHDLEKSPSIERLVNPHPESSNPVIGINIRQWFHFASSFLPYEFSRNLYRERSEEKMESLQEVFSQVINYLRLQFKARILLVSAYQPNVIPWEDDLPWLKQLKQKFKNDPDIVLVDNSLSIPQYFQLMSKLDLMVGMRLHSSLIALRFGVPAINVSYTLKGQDIYYHLGLQDYVIGLQDVLQNPQQLIYMATQKIRNLDLEKIRVQKSVNKVIHENFALLSQLLGEPFFGNSKTD